MMRLYREQCHIIQFSIERSTETNAFYYFLFANEKTSNMVFVIGKRWQMMKFISTCEKKEDDNNEKMREKKKSFFSQII